MPKAEIDPKDEKQAAQLLLISPQSGAPMRFASKLRANPDGTFSFLVEDPATFERYRITVRVEEVLYEDRRANH